MSLRLPLLLTDSDALYSPADSSELSVEDFIGGAYRDAMLNVVDCARLNDKKAMRADIQNFIDANKDTKPDREMLEKYLESFYRFVSNLTNGDDTKADEIKSEHGAEINDSLKEWKPPIEVDSDRIYKKAKTMDVESMQADFKVLWDQRYVMIDCQPNRMTIGDRENKKEGEKSQETPGEVFALKQLEKCEEELQSITEPEDRIDCVLKYASSFHRVHQLGFHAKMASWYDEQNKS